MGAPAEEVDKIAIQEAYLMPESLALYISHHLRNSLAGLQNVAFRLEREGHQKWADKINEIIYHMADDMKQINI
jgi:signal transduction histidine kinase